MADSMTGLVFGPCDKSHIVAKDENGYGEKRFGKEKILNDVREAKICFTHSSMAYISAFVVLQAIIPWSLADQLPYALL